MNDVLQLYFTSGNNGNVDVIEYLLDSGADVNARTKWGDTAGHYAACFASYEALKFLLEEGVDLVKENIGKYFFQRGTLGKE